MAKKCSLKLSDGRRCLMDLNEIANWTVDLDKTAIYLANSSGNATVLHLIQALVEAGFIRRP